MILFLALALALSLGAAVVLVFAVRRALPVDVDRARINVAIFRERQAELAAEREAGRIDAAQHAALLAELQHMLVDDVGNGIEKGGASKAGAVTGGRLLPFALLLLVPALAFAIYLFSGFNTDTRDWLRLSDRVADVAALSQPLTSAAVSAQGLTLSDAARLTQATLLRRPADADAWYRLGMTWLELEVPMLAIESLRTARRLAPERTDIAVTLARVALALNRGQLDDEVRALFDDVLAREPNYQGVLMVYGMAAFDSGDYVTATKRWQELLALIDPQSAGAGLLRQSIARAVQKQQVLAAGGTAMNIPVHVVLAPGIGAAPAGATLFVVVRAAGGASMPVAAKKLAPLLPVDVTLSDADQMLPGAPLSARGPLEVRARISLSGTSVPASGDIESAAVRVILPLNAPVVLTLDRRVP
ncbi:MAG: c-type cytochrome biogenesis protein CcmI [Pseudomonadota bacterium]